MARAPEDEGDDLDSDPERDSARAARGARTRTPMPLTIGLLLLALAVVAWVQGWRTARARHESLQPARGAWIEADAAEAAVVPAAARFAVVELADPPPARLALYRWMPSRTLVRWIETPSGSASRWLVVPLTGLEAGEYAVCAVDAEASAGPREMDLPAERLDVRARFRVDAPPERP